MGRIMPLSNIALTFIDCVAHELSREALRRTLAQIQPQEIHIWTDKPEIFDCGTIHTIPRLKSIVEVDSLLWYELPYVVTTPYILQIQYDGYVLNGDLWRDEWLDYDYIGAPWPWRKDGENIGNGGFSFRSIRMMKHIAECRDEYPLISPGEDDAIGRLYRSRLEAAGFRFPPLSSARAFAFEREAPRPAFGFHGIFNMPHVLDAAQFVEWKRLANAYVRSKVEWKELP